MRRVLLILLFSLLVIVPVQAREILEGETCIVEAEQVIEGALFVLCENLVIDGQVNGDVYGAALRAQINGVVNGSIYIIAAQLDVTGEIQQDLHFGGTVLRLNPHETETGEIGETAESSTEVPDHRLSRSVKSLSLSTLLYENTAIDEGIIGFGYQLILEGDVAHEVNFWGSSLIISGEVAGDINAVVGDPDSDSSQIETLLLPLQVDLSIRPAGLLLQESGAVRGDLHYSGPVEGQIFGEVTGVNDFSSTLTIIPTLDEPETLNSYFEGFGREFSTLLAIGLIAIAFMYKLIQSPVGNLRARPFASLAVGMLGFLLSFPIFLIVLLLSLSVMGLLYILGLSGIIVALGLVLGLVNIASMSVFFFIAIFGARALVAFALGRVILRIAFRRSDIDESRWLPYLALLLGVALLSLVVSLPVIGILVNAFALFLGLGAILNVVIDSLRRMRDTAPTPTPIWYAPSPAGQRVSASQEMPRLSETSIPLPPPPPLVDERTKPPKAGSQNLPDGFDWSFFED